MNTGSAKAHRQGERESSPNPVTTLDYLSALACPACYGALSSTGPETIVCVVCGQCGRVYPVVEGIPVLIVERAAQTPENTTKC